MKQLAKCLAYGLAAALVLGDFELPSDGRNSASLGLPDFSLISPAEARIGRPLTPNSYAGVARRTTRRVARRTARRTAIRLSVLPRGCVYGPYYGAYYYRCGGVYYVHSGGVYVQVVFD